MKSSSWISDLRNIYSTLIVSLCLSLIAGCNSRQHDSINTVYDNQDSCFVKKPAIVSIPKGIALIGSESGYPEERPERQVEIAEFDIDATEVTNAQFSTFIAETGYITSAEQIQPGFNVPGAAVFVPPDISNPNWWRFVEGANWKHPEGPDSTIEGREGEPVVQVSHEDAMTYALWKGRVLPTEAQWEYAAKAGSNTRYVWGDNRTVQGVEQANTWQGAFPIQNTKDDGYLRRSPVGCYPPNDFGLYDMIGNVWEWTDTIYKESETEPVYILKGGSFLCAENYCRRYRPAAKQPQEAGFPTNHIGFRTVSKRK